MNNGEYWKKLSDRIMKQFEEPLVMKEFVETPLEALIVFITFDQVVNIWGDQHDLCRRCWYHQSTVECSRNEECVGGIFVDYNEYEKELS